MAYDEAEQMSRQALSSREKMLAKEHPGTLMSVYCLAFLSHQQQIGRRTRPLYVRALVDYRKVFQSDHPTTKPCSGHYTSLLQEFDETAIAF